MTEPYVPSGKEFDEGLPRRAPRTRVGRAISKVTRRRRKPSRVHELRVHVSDEVGEGRKAVLKQDGRPEGPDTVSATSSKRVVTARTSATRELDAHTQRQLLLVVCGSGDLRRPAVVDFLKTAAQDPNHGPAAQDALGFLVSLAEEDETWEGRALPADVCAVLNHVRSVGLDAYGSLMQNRAQAESALRELEAGQHAYPVLGTIVQLCRSGTATNAKVRTIVGDWNAPVYVTHAHAINTAIAACADLGPGVMQAPVLSPAAVRVAKTDQDIVHACLSRVGVSPVHHRVVATARAHLATQAPNDSGLRGHVDSLGVGSMLAAASRTGQKKVNFRTGTPAAEPLVTPSAARPMSVKCRRCGVLPAERHGMCSGCSNYGD